MKRIFLLLAPGVAVLLLVAGGAFAWQANVIDCPKPVWPPEDMPPPCLGTEGADTIIGTSVPEDNNGDYVKGLGSPDKIYGLEDRDYLYGGAGDDKIRSGPDGGSVDGGGGDDVLIGGSGDELAYGWGGSDRLYGHGWNDLLDGGAGPDLLVGGGGGPSGSVQQLFGGVGSDTIRGGEGYDLIYAADWASEDNDRPSDGKKDTIECGAGQDTVWYKKGEDVVADDCENLHQYQLPPA